MATIELTVPDESMLTNVKRVCKMIKGVASVTVKKDSAQKFDITKTDGYREAMEDVNGGQLNEWNSLDEFFSTMER